MSDLHIKEYNQTEAAIAILRDKYSGPFDVSTSRGMAAAREARAEVRGYRVALEKLRVEIKAPALERTRLIDSEAKRITEKLLEIENPIDAAIKTEERRKEEEKLAIAKAEHERVAAIQNRIQSIRANVISAAGKPSSLMRAICDEVRLTEIAPSIFAELTTEALAAKEETIEAITKMIADKTVDEQEQSRRIAKRAEEEKRLNELRRKQEEEARQIAKQREEIERKQREEQNRLDAEKRKQEEEARQIARKQDALDKKQREIEARERADSERKKRDEEMERLRQAEKEEEERNRAKAESEISKIADPLRRLEQRVLRGLMQPYDAIVESYNLGKEYAVTANQRV